MGLLTSNRSNSNRSNRSEVRGMPPSAQRQLSNGDTAFRMHLSAKDKIEQQQLKTWLRVSSRRLPASNTCEPGAQQQPREPWLIDTRRRSSVGAVVE